MPSIFGMRTSISTTSGRAAPDEVDGCGAVAGLGDDREVGFGLQDHPEPDPDHLLVVDQHDPDHGATAVRLVNGTGNEREDRADPPAAAGPGSGLDRAAQRGDTFSHPDDPEPVGRCGRTPAPRPLSLTSITRRFCVDVQADADLSTGPAWRRTFVSASCTSRYPVTDTLSGRPATSPSTDDGHREVAAGDEGTDQVQRRLRIEFGVRRLGAEYAEDRTEFVHRLSSGRLDRGQCVGRGVGIAWRGCVERPPPGSP